ncbi:Uncharacterized protein Adt_35585 [Abeliophyllum distichum]|uniref:Putative plant transposon protein domain-containing protein n=1 Tax=Abeliophyllum distichum TaxID=126358 RepID=A0ABD1QIL0_9LAMI
MKKDSRTTLASEAFGGERSLQLEDFLPYELNSLIDVYGWLKIAETPHKIYSQLVHEFYTNLNHEIDIHGTEHYRQTWDMGEVARFLYRQDDAWPLPGRDFKHYKLTDSLLMVNVFVRYIIDPSTHRTTINNVRAPFLYHLAHRRKINLESYIYTLISTLGFQTDKRHTANFPSLINGIYEKAGVQISAAEPVIKSKRPINRYALKNEKRQPARAVEVLSAIVEQPQEEQLVTP